jgi:hypothetical protein
VTYSAYGAFGALLFETSKSIGKSASQRRGWKSGKESFGEGLVRFVRFVRTFLQGLSFPLPV